jgi:hypothetical protein
MADTSSYSIEECLVASVWVHERQHTGQTMSQVMAAFRERFNKAPPRRATLLDWEKRAFALESVKDRLRSGRKTTRLETCSGCRFHWTFHSEVGTETIVRAWCATDNNARPHEERPECKLILGLRCIFSGCTATSRPPCTSSYQITVQLLVYEYIRCLQIYSLSYVFVCGSSIFTQYFTTYTNKGTISILFKYLQHSFA